MKKKILHIDDSRIAQIILANIMKEKYELLSLKLINDENCEILDSNDIACFICDYNLNDGNCIDLIKKIRSIKKYYNTPILIYTATATDDIAYKAMLAGANQTISKLIKADELLNIIDRQIKEPRIIKVKQLRREIIFFEWFRAEQYMGFLPDYEITVSASDREALLDKIKAIINEKMDKRGDLDNESLNPRINIYKLELKK